MVMMMIDSPGCWR